MEHSFATPAGTLWAVGPNGLMLRKPVGAASWERVELDAAHDLGAIWADDNGLVIALGRDKEDTVLVRSEDGGVHFTSARLPKDELSLIVGRGPELFAATSAGSLLLSADGGKTFAAKEELATRLRIGFANPKGELYLGGEEGALFVSPAVGQPFKRLSTGTSDDILAIAGDGRAVLIGGGMYLGAGQVRGMLRVSEDQGQSFNSVASEPGGMIGTLSFTGGAWFAVTGEDQLFRAASARGPFKQVARSTDPAPNGTALSVGRDGDLYFPRAQGGSWSRQVPRFRDDLLDVWGRSEREVFAVGMEVTVERPLPGGQSFKGVILQSLDGAATWKRTRVDDVQSLSAVCGSEQGPVFAVGSAGKIIASRGPSQGWEPIESKTGVELTDCFVSSLGTVLVVGAQGTILRSGDQGKTFASVMSAVKEDLSAIHQDEQGAIRVRSRSAGLLSSDDGLSFTAGPAEVDERPVARLADGSQVQLNTIKGEIEWVKDGRVLQTQTTGARALTAVWAGKSLMVVVGEQGAVLTAKP